MEEIANYFLASHSVLLTNQKLWFGQYLAKTRKWRFCLKTYFRKKHSNFILLALSISDWRQVLDSETFRVTRKFGTERAFSSPLNNIKNHSGVFQCSNCGQTLFHAKAKFNSGTGWPSFFDVISPEAIGVDTDYNLGYPR